MVCECGTKSKKEKKMRKAMGFLIVRVKAGKRVDTFSIHTAAMQCRINPTALQARWEERILKLEAKGLDLLGFPKKELVA